MEKILAMNMYRQSVSSACRVVIANSRDACIGVAIYFKEAVAVRVNRGFDFCASGAFYTVPPLECFSYELEVFLTHWEDLLLFPGALRHTTRK